MAARRGPEGGKGLVVEVEGEAGAKVRAKASSPISCQSIRFKITNSANTGTSEGIQINDISVEYRAIYKRVS